MNITIHAEVEGVDAVQSYEGDSIAEAKTFLAGIENIHAIQCNLTAKVNGEQRAMGRVAKGADAPGLLSDINSWLAENE